MARRVLRIGKVLSLAAGIALLGSACGKVGPPELTFYAEGSAIEVAPALYCDVRVTACEAGGGGSDVLTARPGMPVHISVPFEVADSPWLVNVQSIAADGTVLPVRQRFFGPGKAYAFSAAPARPDERILVVEVHQLGAAYAADAQGNPILDESGAPQPVARGVWILRVDGPARTHSRAAPPLWHAFPPQ